MFLNTRHKDYLTFNSCLKLIWMFMKGYPSLLRRPQWRRKSGHDQSVQLEAREDLLKDLILSLPLGKAWWNLFI